MQHSHAPEHALLTQAAAADTHEQLDAIADLAERRARVIAAQSRVAALTRLTQLAIEEPTNTTERETARKAATTPDTLLYSSWSSTRRISR